MPQSADASPRFSRRELIWLLSVWTVLAVMTILFAKQNLSVPGLYYDEAVFAGLAKDFVTGHVHGQHIPNHETITLFGRPFPFFVQSYLGALKSWMLIPAFYLFGPTFAVLRATTLFWAQLALLFLMLGAWRWLGLGTAIIAGALLAFDPNFFFLSLLDWGVAIPSFLCRCACFCFAIRWSQQHKLRDAFLVGLFAGLGFFNKVDYAVLLVSVGIAGFCCYWRQIWALLRTRPHLIALACLGFFLGAGAMVVKVPGILSSAASGQYATGPGEFSEKLHTLIAMYDGSYFLRLLTVGGVFEKMHQEPAAVHSALGLILIVACAVLGAMAIGHNRNRKITRAAGFLALSLALTTLGVFLVPLSVRIHHAILVFPFPQLIIAAAAMFVWDRTSSPRTSRVIQALILTGLLLLLGSQLRAIRKTQQVILETGGRGRWSESLNQFCRENADRSDLTIVSLDWGFNEQLMFLTDGPQLSEPFWGFNQTLPPLPPNPNYIYLAHPLEYSVLKYDVAYLDQLQKNRTNAEITPHFDRQNQVAFYTIRFRAQ